MVSSFFFCPYRPEWRRAICRVAVTILCHGSLHFFSAPLSSMRLQYINLLGPKSHSLVCTLQVESLQNRPPDRRIWTSAIMLANPCLVKASISKVRLPTEDPSGRRPSTPFISEWFAHKSGLDWSSTRPIFTSVSQVSILGNSSPGNAWASCLINWFTLLIPWFSRCHAPISIISATTLSPSRASSPSVCIAIEVGVVGCQIILCARRLQ